MLVLVAYASRHGATQEIAERIAQTLVASGQQVQVHPASAAGGLAGHGAFVVGRAGYMGDRRKEGGGGPRAPGGARAGDLPAPHAAAGAPGAAAEPTPAPPRPGPGRADRLIAALPAKAWRRASVGAGAHGFRGAHRPGLGFASVFRLEARGDYDERAPACRTHIGGLVERGENAVQRRIDGELGEPRDPVRRCVGGALRFDAA